MNMHKDFADWYRAISIEPKPDELQKRWQGVEALADGLTKAQFADIIRLFFGSEIRDQAFLDAFRAPFKTADELFPMRDNHAELRVLGGAVLVELLDYGLDWGNASALGILCMSFGSVRPPAIDQIVSIARTHLFEASLKLRSAAASVPTLPKFEDQMTALKAAFADSEIANLSGPVTEILGSHRKALEELRKWATQSSRQHQLRQEESDALWWVFAKVSRDLNQPFDKIAAEAVPLVAAKELADLVQALPGPLAAPALLTTILRATTEDKLVSKIQLKDAVDAAPLDWRKQTVAIGQLVALDDLCPVNTALRKSAEAEGKRAWQAVFSSSGGIKASERVSAFDLTMQMFSERMLIRAMESIEA